MATLALTVASASATPVQLAQAPGAAGNAAGNPISSRQIEIAQRMLVKLGYTITKLDNQYSLETVAAIQDFQRRHGMPTTGKLGEQLIKTLRNQLWSSGSVQNGRARRSYTTAQMTELQKLLQSQGFDPGPVDGLFGAQTMAAIESFEARSGQTPSGLFSPELIQQLQGRKPARPSVGGNALKVHNWYDYIDRTVLKDFTQATGIAVDYTEFSDSLELFEKLKKGGSGFDVVVPSASFVAEQAEADIFRPLNEAELHNLRHIDPNILKRARTAAKPGVHYGVPYLWGTMGIGYNETMVRARMRNPPLGSLRMLFDPQVISRFQDCGVVIANEPDEVLSLVLAYLGEDPTTEDPLLLARAGDVLKTIQPHVKQFRSNIIEDLATGKLCVVLAFSGDALQAQGKAEEQKTGQTISYAIPAEGSPMWVDLLAIPADAPNPEAAVRFLDYLMEPQIIARISNAMQYANANTAAWRHLSEALRKDTRVHPDNSIKERLYMLGRMSAEGRHTVKTLWESLTSAGASQ